MRAGTNDVNIRPASTQHTNTFRPGQWPKALEDYLLNNPLPLGDRWNIVKMSGDEFKVQAVESVMYLHAKAYHYGSDGVIVSVVGRGLDGKTFKKQISHNDKLISNLTAILQGLAKSMQKTAGGSVEAGVGIDNTKTAASFPSYNPVQTLALSRVKDRAKAARMRAKAIKAVEEALRVVRGSDSQNMKYVVDRAEADLQRIKRMPETSDLYQLIADTSTLNDHFSKLRWEASQLGLREAKMVAHRQNAVPADVERYVEAGTSVDNTRTATSLFRRLEQFSPEQWSEALRDYVLHNPLPSGDQWEIIKASQDEFKVKAEMSPIFFHSKRTVYSDGGVAVRTRFVDSTGKEGEKQNVINDILAETLVLMLERIARLKRKTAKGNIPADVERYVKKVRESNPDYDDAKVWATAWSIFCAHGKRDSEHCKKPADEYFPGRNASDRVLRARLIRLAHENRNLRADLLPLITGEDLTTAVTRVLRARVDALAKELGTPDKFFHVEEMVSGNIWGMSGINITSLSKFKLNVGVTGEMGPTGPKLSVTTNMVTPPEWADEFLKRTMPPGLIGNPVEGTPDVLVQTSGQSAQLHAKFLKPLVELDQRRDAAHDEIFAVIKLFVRDAQKALIPIRRLKPRVHQSNDMDLKDGSRSTPSGLPFYVTTLYINDVLKPKEADDQAKVEAVKQKILAALAPLQAAYNASGLGILLSKKVEYLKTYNTFGVRFMVYFLDAGKPKMKLAASGEEGVGYLRSELIRLAHQNPALRQHLLPLLSDRK